MDHYETLGVARDASADDIKAAYRRCSSKAHPDKAGGSTERMAAVNRANDILSDPERRARYDQTGADDAPKSVDAMAEDLLGSWFSDALDKDREPIAWATRNLREKVEALKVERHNAEVTLANLKKRLGKTRRKGSAKDAKNLVEAILGQKIRAKEHLLAQMAEALTVQGRALEMADDYLPEETEPPADKRTPLQRAQQRFAEEAMRTMPWGNRPA